MFKIILLIFLLTFLSYAKDIDISIENEREIIKILFPYDVNIKDINISVIDNELQIRKSGNLIKTFYGYRYGKAILDRKSEEFHYILMKVNKEK